MKIDTKYILSLNPCRDRLDNYLKHYKDFSGSLIDFLNLDKITWEDKIWVLFREDSLLPEKLMREFAFICASRAVDNCDIEEVKEFFTLVLFIYESGDLDLLDSSEYWAAKRATYWATERATYWAAKRVTYWAAVQAACWAKEENIQKEILINLIGEL